MAFMREVIVESGSNVPGSEVRLIFVKSGYTLDGYTLTVRHMEIVDNLSKILLNM